MRSWAASGAVECAACQMVVAVVARSASSGSGLQDILPEATSFVLQMR
jgi:hypothetical protein